VVEVRVPRRFLFLLAPMLGAALVALPAVAGSEAVPTIEAANSTGSYGEQHHYWSPATATVGAGGVVAISNPSSEVKHGVQWTGGPGTPSCSGVPVGTSGTSWHGECTFSAPGTYTFYCTVHGAEMSGTVTVTPGSTTTTTQPTTTAAAPTTTVPTVSGGSGSPSAPGSTAPSVSPLAGSAATALELPTLQHGTSVRGSVAISEAGTGGRLEVDVLARSASLAAHHAAPVRVGHLVRSSLHAGTIRFAVALSARSRQALRRHRRLALTVRMLLSPPHGAAVSIVRAIVQRP
jgi:plastocyanin